MKTRVGSAATRNRGESPVSAEASDSNSEAIVRVRASLALLMKTKCCDRTWIHNSVGAGKGIGPVILRAGTSPLIPFRTGGTKPVWAATRKEASRSKGLVGDDEARSSKRE